MADPRQYIQYDKNGNIVELAIAPNQIKTPNNTSNTYYQLTKIKCYKDEPYSYIVGISTDLSSLIGSLIKYNNYYWIVSVDTGDRILTQDISGNYEIVDVDDSQDLCRYKLIPVGCGNTESEFVTSGNLYDAVGYDILYEGNRFYVEPYVPNENDNIIDITSEFRILEGRARTCLGELVSCISGDNLLVQLSSDFLSIVSFGNSIKYNNICYLLTTTTRADKENAIAYFDADSIEGEGEDDLWGNFFSICSVCANSFPTSIVDLGCNSLFSVYITYTYEKGDCTSAWCPASFAQTTKTEIPWFAPIFWYKNAPATPHLESFFIGNVGNVWKVRVYITGAPVATCKLVTDPTEVEVICQNNKPTLRDGLFQVQDHLGTPCGTFTLNIYDSL